MDNKIKTITIAIFSLFFLVFFLLSHSVETSFQKNAKEDIKNEVKKDSQKKAVVFDIVLEAKSAYVFDVVKNKPLFELNANAQLPLASLTKVMTAIIAAENISQSSIVEIRRESISQEGNGGLLLGEKWHVFDLIDSMLISSSNDAASALALSFGKSTDEFVSVMNKKAKELNLVQTYFLNPTGLDIYQNTAGGYGSAKDIAELINYSIKNHLSLLEATQYDVLNINSRSFRNTNKLVEELPGIIASKTGFSNLAGGNLVMLINIGLYRPVIIVVLGSSEEGRFRDMQKLYDETINYLINNE